MSGLPDLPVGLPSGLEKYLTKLGEQFEVTQSDRGSPLQAKLTVQDMIDIGLIKADAAQSLRANGKSFNLGSDANWLTPVVPKWFTQELNPPAPTGLVVGMSASNIVLVWTPWASDYYLQTLVYRATTNNLSLAVVIGSTTGQTYVDNLPPTGQAYYYWLRNQSKGGRLSDFNLVSGTTTGNIVTAPSISYQFEGTDLILSWPSPVSALTIAYYIIRYGSSFGAGTAVGTVNANTLRLTVTFGGSRMFWIAAVDVNGQLGTPGSVTVVVSPPSAPTISATVLNDSLVLNYSASQGSLPVSSYELRYGASFAAGTPLAIGSGTRLETVVNWTGSRTFWVVAYDTAGNAGPSSQVTFSPTAPGVVTVTTSVIDNNVLLAWTAASGTLPVAYYQVDRDGTLIGTTLSRFSAVFESISGNFTYGITPVDTAGNVGTRSTAMATVAQPADFVLYANEDSGFGGTKTNAAIDPATGALMLNVDPSETWASHFTSRGWATIQDQVDAGYPLYVVGKTTGSYVEARDYGVLVPATSVKMSPTLAFSTGSATLSGQIEFSVSGSTWSAPTAGYTAYSTSFQFVRYTLSSAAAHTGTGLSTDTAALIAIKPLNYRLDVKQKSWQGMVSALAADSGGTTVDITLAGFVDVSSITLSALGTTPLICIYDFVDAPNPTSFKVLVFNASGTRVNATVSYNLRGV